MQEPLIYRLVEAMQHYGEGIKAIVNEAKGDGIISAIDLIMDVDVIKGTYLVESWSSRLRNRVRNSLSSTLGKHGEDRVVVTMNGKFLPHIEQKTELNTLHRP